MADTQDYLDSLYAKRAKQIGLKGAAFSDQSVSYDFEALEREIARVERALATSGGTRYAATRKGA